MNCGREDGNLDWFLFLECFSVGKGLTWGIKFSNSLMCTFYCFRVLKSNIDVYA